jgi:hypothetical protein
MFLASMLFVMVIGEDGRLGAPHTIQLTVAIEVAPTGSCYLQTDSQDREINRQREHRHEQPSAAPF